VGNHDFIGRSALLDQKKAHDYQRLVGIEVLDRGIPRHSYAITKNGGAVGRITSGTMSPSLKKGIGLGYVSPPYDAIGTDVRIQIRDMSVAARIVKPPFLKK
jgi:aminomethyltransferase